MNDCFTCLKNKIAGQQFEIRPSNIAISEKSGEAVWSFLFLFLGTTYILNLELKSNNYILFHFLTLNVLIIPSIVIILKFDLLYYIQTQQNI